MSAATSTCKLLFQPNRCISYPIRLRGRLSCLLLFAILVSTALKAQNGPDLSAGIDQVTFNQGQLDADLVLQMIATKQGEVKSEIAKRLILNQFECGSFTLYNYARKNVDLLLSNTEKEVVRKELLRNSADLLLVYGLAEFYLAELAGKKNKLPYEPFLNAMILLSDKQHRSTIETRFQYGVQLSCSHSSKSPILRPKIESIRDKRLQKGNCRSIPRIADNVTFSVSKLGANISPQSYLTQIAYLPLFANSYASRSERKRKIIGDCGRISPMHIFIDLVYDICRNEERIQQAGFFTNEDVIDTEYQVRNRYRALQQENLRLYNDIGSVRKEIKQMVRGLFTHFFTLKNMSDAGFHRINNSSLSKYDALLKAPPLPLDSLLSSTQRTLVELPLNKYVTQITNEERATLKTIQEFFTSENYVRQNSEDKAYELKHHILPEVASLNAANQGIFKGLYDTLKGVQIHLEKIALDRLKNDSSFQILDVHNQLTETTIDSLRKDPTLQSIGFKVDLKKISLDSIKRDSTLLSLNVNTEYYVELLIALNNEVNIEYYIPLVDVLNNLSKASSYDKMIRFLTDVGKTYGNHASQRIMHFLASGYDKYTLLDEDNNVLKFDVESMATDLYDTYGANSKYRLSFYLSVGANQAIHLDGGDYRINEGLTLDASQFSFLSEKIGFKWSWIDFNRRRLYNKKNKPSYSNIRSLQRKPIVSDIHTIVYGSGLLYQIEGLSTESDFQSALVGASMGISFFNNLDLNVGYAVPLNSDAERLFGANSAVGYLWIPEYRF